MALDPLGLEKRQLKCASFFYLLPLHNPNLSYIAPLAYAPNDTISKLRIEIQRITQRPLDEDHLL
jgi:hypothetical protein